MSSLAPADNSTVIADAVQVSIGVTFSSIFGEPPQATVSEIPLEQAARVASVISFFGTTPWALTLV